jgi:diguanylate cyclase (GGDEF)-like protein/putative nucleotidyltransferase with HDIG domain
MWSVRSLAAGRAFGLTTSPETARILPIVVPVVVAGVALVGAAVHGIVSSAPSPGLLVGFLALLVAATLVEAFPVSVETLPAGGVSVAAVFIVGTAVLYGWAPAVVMGCLTRATIDLAHRRPTIRLAYNSAVYTLAGGAAGGAALVVDSRHGSVGALILDVALAATASYGANVLLTTAVIARWAGEEFRPLLRSSVYWTAVPFAIMASVSLTLAVLWQRSPLLAVALLGPVVAVALYQRSVASALRAMRLALTDQLTGLGNHRHFHERLERDLDKAQAEGRSLTLCLVDIDDFKHVNDSYGHPVGDRVLAQIAGRLRAGGEAFRLGGDEFAILLPGRDDQQALPVAESVLERISETACEHGETLTVSIGIATYPQHGIERTELVRVADNALYWAKEHGRNQVRIYRPDVIELAELRGLADGPDRAARFRAAASLAHAVDARDAYTGSHSYMVGELAARVAGSMGLEPDHVELIRLAGSLHDLGKLAIPEEVLRKPGPLNDAERLVLQRHPQIGFRMLDSLGVDPVDNWVLHHHERWDGHGYPDKLAGDKIPLSARILLVADAYDAMTTDRIYRRKLSHEAAIRELELCAGTQFDPDVVHAFKAEFQEPTLQLVGTERA